MIFLRTSGFNEQSLNHSLNVNSSKPNSLHYTHLDSVPLYHEYLGESTCPMTSREH